MRKLFSFEFAGTASLLILSLLCVTFTMDRPASSLAQPLSAIPTRIGPWTGAPNPPLDPQASRVLGASSYLSRTYHSGNTSLALFIAYYAQQRAGESMHSPKNCLPGSGWEPVSAATVKVPSGGDPAAINQYLVQNESRRALVLYWYQNRERIYASEYKGKLFLVWDAIMQHDTAGSVVRITLEDQPFALQTGVQFASRVIPLIRACFTGNAPDSAHDSLK